MFPILFPLWSDTECVTCMECVGHKKKKKTCKIKLSNGLNVAYHNLHCIMYMTTKIDICTATQMMNNTTYEFVVVQSHGSYNHRFLDTTAHHVAVTCKFTT